MQSPLVQSLSSQVAGQLCPDGTSSHSAGSEEQLQDVDIAGSEVGPDVFSSPHEMLKILTMTIPHNGQRRFIIDLQSHAAVDVDASTREIVAFDDEPDPSENFIRRSDPS